MYHQKLEIYIFVENRLESYRHCIPMVVCVLFFMVALITAYVFPRLGLVVEEFRPIMSG